tara:strand:+ start:22 stop:414 length:393 start_codon:yes stop_codon:yes gene_type:complete
MKTTNTHIMKNLTTFRLNELTDRLLEQNWIEFEEGDMEFWQLKNLLRGIRVQCVSGNVCFGLSFSQMEEMNEDILEFSLLFCKNELRRIVKEINENDNDDQRKSIVKECEKELNKQRRNQWDNILLLESI